MKRKIQVFEKKYNEYPLLNDSQAQNEKKILIPIFPISHFLSCPAVNKFDELCI